MSLSIGSPNLATVALMWENKKLPFKVEVQNMKELYVTNMRNELQGTAGFNYQGWANAANYCVQNDYNLEEALTWADNAISAPFIGQKNFTTLQTKAQVLTKLNRAEEAAGIMAEAIKHPSATPFQIHGYGRQLIAQGKKEKALEVFKFNFENMEGAWPTHVGMARGLSAVGKYEKAVEHAKIALEQAPDDLNRNNLTQAIEKLKKGEDIN